MTDPEERVRSAVDLDQIELTLLRAPDDPDSLL